MKSNENKSTVITNEFISLTQEKHETIFPVRDADNKKLEATELFSLFTADIIKKDVKFIR